MKPHHSSSSQKLIAGMIALMSIVPSLSYGASLLIVTSQWAEITAGNAELQGTKTTSTADYNGDAVTDFRSARVFSEATELSPQLSKPGYNTDFYGGMQATYFSTTTTINWGRTQVRNVTGDPITNITGTYAGSKGTQGLVFWQSPGYQNVASPDYATFASATDQMTITLIVDGTMPTFRFLVKTGDTYYVSESTATVTATLNDPASSHWAPYSPASNLDFDQSAATFGTIPFGELQAVGYY